MKQEIKKLKNGDIEFTISFDMTKHNHFLGEARNYDMQQVTNLIRDTKTQHHINAGYCLGYLGHSARQKMNNPHIAKEKDGEGNTVEPCIKTTGLKIKGNIITHKQVVINTEIGRKVLKFADSGFGGFSFAISPENGIFAGADYVYSPNYNDNRIIEGSICKGECNTNNIVSQLHFDSIGELDYNDIVDFVRDSKELLVIDKVNNLKQDEIDNIRLMFDEVVTGLRDELRVKDMELNKINLLLKSQNLRIENDRIVFDDIFMSNTLSFDNVVMNGEQRKKLLSDLKKASNEPMIQHSVPYWS